MYDLTGAALNAAAHNSLYAFPAVAIAGVLSSAGPCVAPRLLAITALCGGRDRGSARLNLFCFVLGIVIVYASFAAGAAVLAKILTASGIMYSVLAASLAAAGLRALWHPAVECCDHGAKKPQTAGAAFFLGVALSFVVSPCCTPVLVAILGVASAGGNALYGAALLTCFAIGHCLPVCAFAMGARGCTSLLRRAAGGPAMSVITATVMLALSGYYAVLV